MLLNISPRLLLALIITTNASLVGLGFTILSERLFQRIKRYLFYLGTGILLGTIFLHAMPELVEQATDFAISTKLMLSGTLIAFIVEKISCWHHCHVPFSNNNTQHRKHNKNHSRTHQLVRYNKSLIITNILGDSLHNFLHGFILYNAYNISNSLGFSILIGILGHEIPGEIADISILLHAGISLKQAIILNWLVSLTTVLGTLLGLIPIPSNYIFAVGIGILLYIALTDLLGELRHNIESTLNFIKQFILLLIGISIMAVL